MIHVRDDVPPEENFAVLVRDVYNGYEVSRAFLVRQHIRYDLYSLGYSRVVEWGKLPPINKKRRE